MRFAIPKPSRHRRKSFQDEYRFVKRASGREAEIRFFRVVQQCRDRWPRWLQSVEPATVALDKAGVDAVVELDSGRVYLNIKNSRESSDLFQMRDDRRLIPVIIVGREMNDEEIFAAFVSLLNLGGEKSVSKQVIPAV